MAPPTVHRRLVIYVTLLGCGLAVCGWQVEEHLRFKRDAAQALINRGRDITSTLGVLVRSQRRFGIVSKERLQSGLQDLIRPGELESIAILSATGEIVANAGHPVEITPDMLAARGVYSRDGTVTIMNLMDLGSTTGEDGLRPRPAIVVNEDQARAFGRATPRRVPEARPNADPAGAPTGVATEMPTAAPPATARPSFPRPSFMAKEEYDAVIQKQGVNSLVISLSTTEKDRAVKADLLTRSLVSLLAMGGAIVSALAWRNVEKNSELQIRLVKAGEMNLHLKAMNLTAAGLAHETRNPLNLIRGLAQMIAMQAKEAPKLKEHASTIIEEADRVTVQLNEFINYSKPREPQLAPVAVAALIADVVRTLQPDLDEKQIQLHQAETALRIEADEQLLRQALFNVLLNATQVLGPGGRIDVRLTPVGSREAQLEISDDGPGVPAADRATIFRPYVTMRPKGVGLGLAIVAQIVSAHHWEVACLAHAPRGAVFRFSHLKIATPAL